MICKSVFFFNSGRVAHDLWGGMIIIETDAGPKFRAKQPRRQQSRSLPFYVI